jgi:hypothetical protein
VLGNGHGATTNDVFAKAMVVGAPCLRYVPDAGCHLRRITCTSENLNDIAGDALANKKFRMSAYTAGRNSVDRYTGLDWPTVEALDDAALG